MEDFTLYWRQGSAAMAPHAALAEVGAGYTLIEIDRDTAQANPEYRRLNPMGVVPTLIAGDRVITESAAILLYLADRFPKSRLAPEDRTGLYQSLIFLTNTLQPAMMRFFYPERYGAGRVDAVAQEEAGRLFDMIDRTLADRDWLAGTDQRSAADLFLFMVTRWGRRLDHPAWDRPNLRRHFLRTLALPGVRRMIDEQDIDLPDWAG